MKVGYLFYSLSACSLILYAAKNEANEKSISEDGKFYMCNEISKRQLKCEDLEFYTEIKDENLKIELSRELFKNIELGKVKHFNFAQESLVREKMSSYLSASEFKTKKLGLELYSLITDQNGVKFKEFSENPDNYFKKRELYQFGDRRLVPDVEFSDEEIVRILQLAREDFRRGTLRAEDVMAAFYKTSSDTVANTRTETYAVPKRVAERDAESAVATRTEASAIGRRWATDIIRRIEMADLDDGVRSQLDQISPSDTMFAPSILNKGEHDK